MIPRGVNGVAAEVLSPGWAIQIPTSLRHNTRYDERPLIQPGGVGPPEFSGVRAVNGEDVTDVRLSRVVPVNSPAVPRSQAVAQTLKLRREVVLASYRPTVGAPALALVPGQSPSARLFDRRPGGWRPRR